MVAALTVAAAAEAETKEVAAEAAVKAATGEAGEESPEVMAEKPPLEEGEIARRIYLETALQFCLTILAAASLHHTKPPFRPSDVRKHLPFQAHRQRLPRCNDVCRSQRLHRFPCLQMHWWDPTAVNAHFPCLC